jgi:hypothetical protein
MSNNFDNSPTSSGVRPQDGVKPQDITAKSSPQETSLRSASGKQ